MDCKKLAIVFKLNWVKTIYANLKYFPLKQAVKLPLFIYRHTKLKVTRGEIRLMCPAAPGLIKFGTKGVGTIDVRYSRAIWEVSGRLIVRGAANFGLGSKLCICPGGVVDLGKDFTVTGNTAIICQKEIKAGEGCLISWDALIMDTDFHKIYDAEGRQINEAATIRLGDRVWVGCRNIILKGAEIPSDTVVGAGALITKHFTEPGTIIAGRDNNQRIIKSGIKWEK